MGGGYGLYLLQTLLALGGVCLLAWVFLRWGARRLYGGMGGGRMHIVERVALGPRAALFLVEVGGKVLVVGAGEGAPRLVAEIDPAALGAVAAPQHGKFLDAFKRARAGGDAPRS